MEIQAANTRWIAPQNAMNAFATYITGFQWSIYRNVAKPALHWDFVSFLKMLVGVNKAKLACRRARLAVLLVRQLRMAREYY
jgi:hypothetical protein